MSSSSVDNRKEDENVEQEEGEVVNLVDVVAEEEALEEDARAVLGSTDDKSCTYLQGYVKRQPLYACQTCRNRNEDADSGICLGCSLHCHEGHELVELYTKRNFRCDCGNKKFGEPFKCVLNPEKDAINELNSYNQNFSGLYCSCSRPYPDPSEDVDDEMFQCVVCEDWFHGRHIGASDDKAFSELVCPLCAERLPFLHSYANWQKIDTTISQSQIEETNGKQDEIEKDKKTDICRKPVDSSDEPKTGTVFFDDKWRERLCTCHSCKLMYVEHKCEFLLDETDTLEAYEENNRANMSASVDTVERGLKVFNEHVDRFQQVEILHEYNTMKAELLVYLKKFAATGKVVREEDIREFFEGLKSNKRQRLS